VYDDDHDEMQACEANPDPGSALGLCPQGLPSSDPLHWLHAVCPMADRVRVDHAPVPALIGEDAWGGYLAERA
jgi:hypothetical protein